MQVYYKASDIWYDLAFGLEQVHESKVQQDDVRIERSEMAMHALLPYLCIVISN